MTADTLVQELVADSSTGGHFEPAAARRRAVGDGMTSAQVDRIATEHNLIHAHAGSNGTETGIWGIDDRGRVTFVIVGRRAR